MKEAVIGTVAGLNVKVFPHNGNIHISEPGRLGIEFEDPDDIAEFANLLHQAAAKAARLKAALRQWELDKLHAATELSRAQEDILGQEPPK